MNPSQKRDWHEVADRILDGGSATTREEARTMLIASDEEVLDLLAAAYRLRRAAFSRNVHLYRLLNIQSGLCQEDCNYCSQSRVSSAAIDSYPMMEKDRILERAQEAQRLGCSTFCLVASGRGPKDRDLEAVCEAVRGIKEQNDLHVCACLGLLQGGQARRLREAGVDRYNHNLNASAGFTPRMVSTHTYADRVDTIQHVKAAGISPCSGAIFGMGETVEDRVDVAFALRDIGSESIPCNFLHAIPGTPFAGTPRLGANECLKILAMMRFVNPSTEIRIAGGREVQLGGAQGLGLYAANSLFVNGYLTTPGQGAARDVQMIRDLGFQVESRPARGG